MKESETRYFLRLGRRMLDRRIRAGLSQRELEHRLGYTSNMVSGYERGRKEPRLTTLLAFAGAFGCDIRDLIPASTSEADDPQINGLEAIAAAPTQYKPPEPAPIPPAAAPVEAPVKKTDRVDALQNRSGAMPWSDDEDKTDPAVSW